MKNIKHEEISKDSKALLKVPALPEHEMLAKMKPDNLTIPNGIELIRIMRSKAEENNHIFDNDYWSPRKIDMVLWGIRE